MQRMKELEIDIKLWKWQNQKHKWHEKFYHKILQYLSNGSMNETFFIFKISALHAFPERKAFKSFFEKKIRQVIDKH
jgi:hypothetical protein